MTNSEILGPDEGREINPDRAEEMARAQDSFMNLARSWAEIGDEEGARKALEDAEETARQVGMRYDEQSKAREEQAIRDQAQQAEQKTAAEESVTKAVRQVGEWLGKALKKEHLLQQQEPGIIVNLKLGRVGREYMAERTGEASILPQDPDQAKKAISGIFKFLGVDEAEVDQEARALIDHDQSHQPKPGKHLREWHSDKFSQVFLEIPPKYKENPEAIIIIYVS